MTKGSEELRLLTKHMKGKQGEYETRSNNLYMKREQQNWQRRQRINLYIICFKTLMRVAMMGERKLKKGISVKEKQIEKKRIFVVVEST